MVGNKLKEERKKYLTMQSAHFIYGFTVSDVWLRTTEIMSEET